MNCFVDINEKNRPVFISSIFSKLVYSKYLDKRYPDDRRATKLNGTNFFGMGDKDQLSKIMADVIFWPFIINENQFKMFVISASSYRKL